MRFSTEEGQALLNAEHYKDPTAAQAVNEVSKVQPITYFSKPAFIRTKQEQRPPYKSINVEEMSMDDLRPHVYNCAKSKMSLSTCTQCNPGCVFGRRVKEIMEQEANPEPVNNSLRGPTANKIRSMKEYQAAIESGDVFQYAFEHAKSSDPKKAKAAAWARVNFWRKNYGGLIKETPKPKQDPASEEKPHLMQMPCLSKKVAAERAAEKSLGGSTNVTKVFTDKLSALKDELAGVQKQIEDLKSREDAIRKQIGTIEETADMLNVVIA